MDRFKEQYQYARYTMVGIGGIVDGMARFNGSISEFLASRVKQSSGPIFEFAQNLLSNHQFPIEKLAGGALAGIGAAAIVAVGWDIFEKVRARQVKLS